MKSPILVVEDSDVKFQHIAAVVRSAIGESDFEIVRAHNAITAEHYISGGHWTLIVLDISLNIAETRRSNNGGHATLGGLGIIERMFLLDQAAPTVIVTAFDAFEAKGGNGMKSALVDLNYIDDYARKTLNADFLGSVRYSSDGWERDLLSKITEIVF